MQKTWLAWLTLSVGLLVTVFVSLQVKRSIEQEAVKQFALVCDQVTLKIQERLSAYALILRGGEAFFEASKEVERNEWRAYVEALHAERIVPSIQGIGFAQVIPAAELATHIANIRAEGFPEYIVRPAGKRAIYTSIVYLEPFRGPNLRAFGYDMYSEPVRRVAMEQARDTGKAALSGKVELMQETGTEVQAGTLMYVPVYRNGMPKDTVGQRRAALIGWAYSPYRMNNLMDGILAEWERHQGKTIDLHIYDGREATPASLLFDSKPTNLFYLNPLFYQQRTIDFNGHQWLLAFDHTGKPSDLIYTDAWLVLTCGLALSSLLFVLILSLINTRAYAVAIKRHGEILKENENRFRTLIECSPGPICVHRDRKLIYINPAAIKMFGATAAQDLIGKHILDVIHPDFHQSVLAWLKNMTYYVGGMPLHEEKWLKLDGTAIDVTTQTEVIVYDGEPSFQVFAYDITSLKENEKRLEQIAHFDALTGLPNRVLLADRLHQTMVQVQRRGQRLVVAFLDLDGFKTINDNHGHEAGDQLLIAVSVRMKQALREGDTLSRLGGDEFVAVLPDLADIETSVPMLTRLLAAAAQPVHVDDLILQVSASLGVTFYPQAEAIDADQLLRQADQAMYQAKLTGKNRYHFFDAEQDSRIRNYHVSLDRICRALTEREFVLYYQPKVNMRMGTVIGAEALIRWQHPERGLLLPASFLPAIENHPLAVELGEWVIDTALTQTELWHVEGLDIPVSVNVGARQLQQSDFVERLRALLATHPGVRPGDLVMEVLETSALEDLVHVSRVINTCREIGVMFALDDFGTGYSSLTHLKRLPVTQLKIDQTFVSSMLDSPDDLAILEVVLGMAAAFQHQVIAEGVETVEHGEMLLQFDCELAQGYGIARPMPAHEMSGWLAAWRTEPSWCDLPAVSHDDLPLLVASAEHRAWIAALEAFLKDEREAPPPMDRHQCRFGMWLDTKGLVRYGAQPAFEAIELLHREVHVLGTELLELQARGRNPDALERLGELHDLRDALLKQLKMLVLESQQ